MRVTPLPVLNRWGTAEGYNGRLAYPYILFGNLETQIWDVRTNTLVFKAPHRNAYPAGWIHRPGDAPRACWTTGDDGPDKSQRQGWEAELYGDHWVTRLVFDFTDMGSSPTVKHGHWYWATSRNGAFIDGRQFVYGWFLMQSVRAGGDGYVCMVEDALRNQSSYRLWLFKDGDAVRYGNEILAVWEPLPSAANAMIPGTDARVAYGYWGPTFEHPFTGPDRDITRTPWRQEAVPLVISSAEGPWAIRPASKQFQNGMLLLSGPLNAEEIVVIEDIATTWVDAEWLDRDRLVIVGSDEKGQAVLIEHTRQDARRRLVMETKPPDTPKPPDPPKPPKPPDPPKPPKPPKPPMPPTWNYNEDTVRRATEWLEEFYRTTVREVDGRGPRETFVDVIGYGRWIGNDFILAMVSGVTPREAIERIRRNINAILGKAANAGPTNPF